MPIPLRSDYDQARVRVAARESKNANQVRRLLALAAIYDGASRAEAAEIGGVTRQIIRDWVLKFNTDGPDGLIDRKAPGQPSRLNETHRTALAAAICCYAWNKLVAQPWTVISLGLRDWAHGS